MWILVTTPLLRSISSSTKWVRLSLFTKRSGFYRKTNKCFVKWEQLDEVGEVEPMDTLQRGVQWMGGAVDGGSTM